MWLPIRRQVLPYYLFTLLILGSLALSGCMREEIPADEFSPAAGGANAGDAGQLEDAPATDIISGADASPQDAPAVDTKADTQDSIDTTIIGDVGVTDGGADGGTVDSGSGSEAEDGTDAQPDTVATPDTGPTKCTSAADCAAVIPASSLGACEKVACWGGTCGKTEVSSGSCDDSNACTLGDNCVVGTCIPGTKKQQCDDSNPCTTDSCTPEKGCVAAPVKDGTVCGSNQVCVTGKCQLQGVCGDGQINVAGETCDDGNKSAGDGCSPQCTWECATLKFVGTGHAQAKHHTALNLLATDYTIEFMVRLDKSGAGKDQTFVAKRPAKGTGVGYTLGIYDGKLAFRLGGDQQVAHAVVAAGLPLSKWTHVALVYHQGTSVATLFVNGMLVATKAAFPAPKLSYEDVLLGMENTSGVSRLHGELAWVHVLTAAKYKKSFSVPTTFSKEQASLALWPLKAGQGSVAKDLSGNGHDATLSQVTWATGAPVCLPSASCGDGKQADWESCDDGNKLFGDGCDNGCQLEQQPFGGLIDAAFVFDPKQNAGWLFGGQAWHDLSGTLWRYSATQTEPVWSAVSAGPGPKPRARAIFARDPASKRTFLWGGQGYYETYADLWRLDDGVAGSPKWTQLKPTGTAPAPAHAGVGWWEPQAKRFIVGLGETYYDLVDGFWAYDPAANTWAKLAVTGATIQPRRGAMLAWDGINQAAWLAGGETWYDLLSDLHRLTWKSGKLVAEKISIAFGALPALTSGCAVAHAGVVMLMGGEGFYDQHAALKLSGKDGKGSELLAPASRGGVCLRKADGSVIRLLGQGWYGPAGLPYLSKLP